MKNVKVLSEGTSYRSDDVVKLIVKALMQHNLIQNTQTEVGWNEIIVTKYPEQGEVSYVIPFSLLTSGFYAYPSDILRCDKHIVRVTGALSVALVDAVNKKKWRLAIEVHVPIPEEQDTSKGYSDADKPAMTVKRMLH